MCAIFTLCHRASMRISHLPVKRLKIRKNRASLSSEKQQVLCDSAAFSTSKMEFAVFVARLERGEVLFHYLSTHFRKMPEVS